MTRVGGGVLKLAVMVASLAAFSQAQAATQDADFCKQFVAVHDGAFRGFRNFRGPYNNGSEDYISNIKLPHAQFCYISESIIEYKYTCVWHYGNAEPSLALSDAKAMLESIRTCMAGKTNQYSYLPDQTREDHGGFAIEWRGAVLDDDFFETTNVALYHTYAQKKEPDMYFINLNIVYRKSR